MVLMVRMRVCECVCVGIPHICGYHLTELCTFSMVNGDAIELPVKYWLCKAPLFYYAQYTSTTVELWIARYWLVDIWQLALLKILNTPNILKHGNKSALIGYTQAYFGSNAHFFKFQAARQWIVGQWLKFLLFSAWFSVAPYGYDKVIIVELFALKTAWANQ